MTRDKSPDEERPTEQPKLERETVKDLEPREDADDVAGGAGGVASTAPRCS